MRIGMGYDVHRLVEGRKLILGGVEIPFEKGLLGHSDADVLVHALMDAILGAMAMRDIGYHFPDTDEAYRDISSMVLLARVKALMDGAGYALGNADITLMAERPKIAPYIDAMTQSIAHTLEVSPDAIGIKATTTEGLGFVGRGEGMAAQAVVLIEKKRRDFGDA